MPGIIVNHEQLDSDPWLLNVANGTIDLRTGELRPHNPDDLCTMQAPVAYDPNAVAPLWDKCLEVWQPDDDGPRLPTDPRRRWRYRRSPPRPSTSTTATAATASRSSTAPIQHVLGPYATVPHKSLLVAGRFEQHPTVIAKLFRKRLAVASETRRRRGAQRGAGQEPDRR